MGGKVPGTSTGVTHGGGWTNKGGRFSKEGLIFANKTPKDSSEIMKHITNTAIPKGKLYSIHDDPGAHKGYDGKSDKDWKKRGMGWDPAHVEIYGVGFGQGEKYQNKVETSIGYPEGIISKVMAPWKNQAGGGREDEKKWRKKYWADSEENMEQAIIDEFKKNGAVITKSQF